MRTFWLTARIAALFFLLLVGCLVATLHLFGRVAGRDLVHELITLRANEGALLAERLETLLESHDLSDPAVAALLITTRAERDFELVLLDLDAVPIAAGCMGCEILPRKMRFKRDVESRGRICQVTMNRPFDVLVPIHQEGVQVATLAINRPDDRVNIHHRFMFGLFRIGLVGLAGILALAVYLTRPIRSMSRSMDRVAAGELDHRVPARGRDEVARMGQSFNAMADRIHTMIVGQKELLAGVSHELRSPLARMKLILELMRNRQGSPARVDDLETEVDALDGMVEELLVASRLDLGEAPLETEHVDLEVLVEAGWRRIADAAEEKDIQLHTAIHTGAEIVDVDPDLVVRILGNLFENAVRHGGEGPVRFDAQPRDGRVGVVVTDGGAGVAPDQIEQLFEPFFRADSSRSRKTGGTGLGLMVVRRAIEAHGGQVTASNDPDGGLAVAFDLPAP